MTRVVAVSCGEIIVAVLAWYGVAGAAAGVPTPHEVLVWAINDWRLLTLSTAATTMRALAGLALATLVGVVLGYLISLSRYADTLAATPLNFFRAIPSALLISLLAFWVRSSSLSLVVVLYGCVWPITLNIRDRMRAIPREVPQSLDALEMPVMRRIATVYSRALLPGIVAGVRVSLAIALILAVSVELIIPPATFFGISHGLSGDSRSLAWALGAYVSFYYQQAQLAPVIAAVILAGVVSAILSAAYHRVTAWLLRRECLDEAA